ncbi:MAG: DivIVA domain-containing protein, partial [Clostridia bacterium]|nr:DivIVA domain-containing protein [Clostridia bacterium]
MPKDFRKKDFGRALRGYSVDEVDKYLDAVTTEYRRLEKRSWETAKQLADAEKRLDDYAAAEADAAETLDAADSILADANRQADALIADSRIRASEEAEGILNEANAAAAKTKDDALLLR